MKPNAEHEKLKKTITQGQVKRVQGCATPTLAAQEILNLEDPKMACALIDSLDPLTAAFVVMILREWSSKRMDSTKQVESWATAILTHAQKLDIKGLKGLCHARDEIFRTTGAFVC